MNPILSKTNVDFVEALISSTRVEDNESSFSISSRLLIPKINLSIKNKEQQYRC